MSAQQPIQASTILPEVNAEPAPPKARDVSALSETDTISDEEFKGIVDKVKAMQQAQQKTLLQELVDICKSYNGYPYISASMLTSLPDDEKKYSLLTQTLLLGFMIKGGKSVEDFKKTFIGTGVVFIQAHKGLPTLGEDGLYSGYDPDHNLIKTINVKRLLLCSDPKDFKPLIVTRRREPDGKWSFGKLEGDPYHKFSAAELAAVIKQGEEEQQLAKQNED